MRKQGDGYVIWSEESITLDDALPSPRISVTDSLLSLWAMSFGLRHHDVFCSPLIMTRFPKIVILNGGKNAS